MTALRRASPEGLNTGSTPRSASTSPEREQRGRAHVLRLLDQALAAAAAHGHEEQAERLRQTRRRLARPPRHAVVVGEFKSGKSTLLNALLNVRLCPTDADIATAVPSIVRYGGALRVQALADDADLGRGGDPPDPAAGGGGTLDPAAEGGTPDSAAVGGGTLDAAAAAAAALGGDDDTRALDVTVPRRLLRDGLVLVDTPGVGGGLSSRHAAIALRCLRSVASVAVVVSDAGAEYSATELAFIGAVAAECPAVLCVLTKIDLYPQWRRVAAANRERLDRLGLATELLPLSAPLRYAGLRDGDRELLVDSGFPALTARLLTLSSERTQPQLTEAAAAARTVVGRLLAALAARRAALVGETVAAASEQAWAADEQLAAELRGAGARWQHVLSDRLGDLQADADVDLVTRLRALRKEAVATLAELPPARVAADLGPWLQRRTTEELLDHTREVRAGAEQVVDAVADEFGSAAQQLRTAVVVSLDGEVAEAAAAASFEPLGPGTSLSEPGMAAIRGGTTGAVLANAAGLVLGLSVPVVAPAAVALGGVLAGKSWHGARAARAQQRKIELERAIVAYLDDVDVLARKESRGAVRALQRRLKDAFLASAQELAETARSTAERLRRDAASSEESRAAALRELDTELERLRVLHEACAAVISDGLAADDRVAR